MSKESGIQKNQISTDTSTFDKAYEQSPFNRNSVKYNSK